MDKSGAGRGSCGCWGEAKQFLDLRPFAEGAPGGLFSLSLSLSKRQCDKAVIMAGFLFPFACMRLAICQQNSSGGDGGFRMCGPTLDTWLHRRTHVRPYYTQREREREEDHFSARVRKQW